MAFHLNTILAFTSVAGALRYPQPTFGEVEESPALVTATAADLEMKPCPVEPSWVLSGNPEARIGEHSNSDDEAGMTAVWDCTAGRFKWYYGWDETVMILEGEVHVTGEDGVTRTLRAGDIAYFKGKTWARWHIENYVRKVAFLRRPFPAKLQFAIKLYNKFKAWRSGGAPLRSGL